jgi:hypothetical protein
MRMSLRSQLRFTRAVWFIVSTGAIAAWYALYLIRKNDPNGIVILDQLGPGYRAYWILAAAVCLLLFVSVLLRRHVLVGHQRMNEAAAMRLLDRLRTSEAFDKTRYFVYLRAFETTGHLKPPFFFSLSVLQRLHANELESFLALALESQGALLGLGLPGENVGAARIRVDDAEWKAAIERLLTHATGVLLLPSAHEGTRWEIAFLQQQGLLQKTVFIMPPRSRRFDWRARCQQAAEALGELRIALPAYSGRGLLFTVDASGQVADARPFSLFYKRSIRNSIQKLLAHTAHAQSGEEAIRKANRESRLSWFYGRWITVAGSLILFALFLWSGLNGVLSGRALPGVDPPPSWSGFSARYDSASEVGSGQSIVDARMFLAHHNLSESQIDEVANRGLLRVGDSERTMYLSGLGELLSHAADEASCAALAEGRASSATRTRTLVQMPDSHVRIWMQARQSAVFAEIDQRPILDKGRPQPAEAQQAVASVLGERVAADLDRILTTTGRLPDKQVCELGIAGGAALYRMQEPYRTQFAAILAKRFATLE